MTIATQDQQQRVVAAAQAYLAAIALPEFLNLAGTEEQFEIDYEKAFLSTSGVFAALNDAEGSPIAFASGAGRAVGVVLAQMSDPKLRGDILEGLMLGLQIGRDEASTEFAPRGNA